MKKQFFLILFLLVSGLTFGQTRYQYVIIPTQFPDVASGFNPYNLCASIQQVLADKSIKSQIQHDENPLDLCDALTVNVEKVAGLLWVKAHVELKNCRNKTVWESVGTGDSKEFPQGYAEAFADAMKGLDQLPINPMADATVAVASQPEGSVQVELGQDAADYKPKNPYYNSTYFLDLVDGDGGSKKLVIINGKLLGYKDLQIIGTLTPSGLENVYNLKWINADGDQLTGVANLTDSELKISLPSGGTAKVISLKKL